MPLTLSFVISTTVLSSRRSVVSVPPATPTGFSRRRLSAGSFNRVDTGQLDLWLSARIARFPRSEEHDVR